MENSKMKKHITLVGSIQIGFSIIGLMGAVAIFAALSFALTQTRYDEVAQIVLKFLSISIPLITGTFAMVGLIAGIGLIAYKPWARLMIILVATLGCINIPFGTIKGIYSIWVLQKDESIDLFTKKE
jgi:hypothetical protein